MTKRGPDSSGGFQKVVVHLGNGVIRGFLEARPGDALEAFLRNGSPGLLRIRPVGEDTFQEISIESTKAVFFVKDFEGDPHKNLRFYRGAEIVHGVWIRLEFKDREIMEGLVHNTLDFLVDPGFFMYPTDPYSNNRLVYVVKSCLKECRILGLRMTLPRESVALPSCSDTEGKRS